MYIRKILLSSVLGALVIALMSGCAPIVPAPTIERVVVPLDKDLHRVYHYQVRSGDTLYAISRLHGLSVDQIAQMNDIDEPYVIHPGQRLVVDHNLISRKATQSVVGSQNDLNPQVALASQTDTSSVQGDAVRAKSSGVTVSKMPRPPTTKPVTSLNTPQSTDSSGKTKGSGGQSGTNAGQSQSAQIFGTTTIKPPSKEVTAGSSATETKKPQPESSSRTEQTPNIAVSREVSTQNRKSSTASETPKDASRSFIARTEPNNSQTDTSSTQSVDSLPKGWTWPVSAKPTNSFGKHDGLNYFLNLGNKVVAAASGRVTYAGSALSDFKYMVLIKTPDDYVIQYDFNVDLNVQENDLISKGQDLIKIVNNSARQQTSGSEQYREVFFAIRKKGVPQDPNKLISKPKAEEI